ELVILLRIWRAVVLDAHLAETATVLCAELAMLGEQLQAASETGAVQAAGMVVDVNAAGHLRSGLEHFGLGDHRRGVVVLGAALVVVAPSQELPGEQLACRPLAIAPLPAMRPQIADIDAPRNHAVADRRAEQR